MCSLAHASGYRGATKPAIAPFPLFRPTPASLIPLRPDMMEGDDYSLSAYCETVGGRGPAGQATSGTLSFERLSDATETDKTAENRSFKIHKMASVGSYG